MWRRSERSSESRILVNIRELQRALFTSAPCALASSHRFIFRKADLQRRSRIIQESAGSRYGELYKEVRSRHVWLMSSRENFCRWTLIGEIRWRFIGHLKQAIWIITQRTRYTTHTLSICCLSGCYTVMRCVVEQPPQAPVLRLEKRLLSVPCSIPDYMRCLGAGRYRIKAELKNIITVNFCHFSVLKTYLSALTGSPATGVATFHAEK